MKISEYVKKYTSGDFIGFRRFVGEIGELLVEIFKFDREKIIEEYQDVLHHLQLWLYWRFGLDGEVWESTRQTVNKFMARLEVWRKIYKFSGLDENISNFCGNYNRKGKVIKQLEKFGIAPDVAEKAYNKVVLNK